MGAYLRKLSPFDTVTPLSLQTRGPGVYDEVFQIEGNSILSTVFVEWADPGAEVVVSWFDTTTGEAVGEVYNLIEHRPLSSFGTDRITVTRIHNKPQLKATVTGGNVRFSVYITVVTSFASDLDAALQFEGDPVSILRDKGMPITAYETTTDQWSFLRTKDGRLQIDVPGILQVSQQVINFRRYNETLSLVGGALVEHINYTVPVGKKLYWLGGNGSADGWAVWRVDVDGVRFLTKRNAFDQPDVSLCLNAPVTFLAGQQISVTVENVGGFGHTIHTESFLYGALEDV